MLNQLLRLLVIAITLVPLSGLVATTKAQSGSAPSGKIRTYYVAADEVEWNYAPDGINKMMGMKFSGYPNVFIEQGPHRIGAIYRKAVYREYTDETFSKLKPRAPEWEHAGILGPIVRAEVGDTIRVTFKNNATHAASMHSHGVFYNKDSEGASYDDGTTGNDKADDDVQPGATHVYTWEVPERAGPGPGDPSSLVWLYHSHGNKGLESGLIGAIIITARGMARRMADPKMWIGSSSISSWFLTKIPAGISITTFRPTPAIPKA